MSDVYCVSMYSRKIKKAVHRFLKERPRECRNNEKEKTRKEKKTERERIIQCEMPDKILWCISSLRTQQTIQCSLYIVTVGFQCCNCLVPAESHRCELLDRLDVIVDRRRDRTRFLTPRGVL